MTVVAINRLNHAFGQGDLRRQVLFDVDLEVKAGELVILTGPSGCGKTTLLTLAGGLRSVQEGSLRVLGRELFGQGEPGLMAVRRDIGFIFQSHNLLDALTAAENVTLALDLKSYTAESLAGHARQLLGGLDEGTNGDGFLNGVPRRIGAVTQALASGLLTHLQLRDRLHHKPGQLSVGQKQRVAIARALVNGPRLILADEPTAALDKESGAIVLDLLRKFTRAGAAALLVTHDPKVMERGDRVVSLKDGRVA
jgi:putative ABC transport system ATP-binding protein